MTLGTFPVGSYPEGIAFGELGLSLLEPLAATAFECKAHCVFGTFSPHGIPLRDSLAHFTRAGNSRTPESAASLPREPSGEASG